MPLKPELQFLHDVYADISRLDWSVYIYFVGTPPYKNLTELLTKKALVKDIRQISGQHATSSLEAFHSVQNHFAAKIPGLLISWNEKQLQTAQM